MTKSSDDHSLVAAGAALPGLLALGAIIGSSGVDYVRDLAGSIERLFGRDGLEAALREERARAKANVIALAVIADGAVTDAERAAIGAFGAKHGIDPDEAIAKVTALVEDVRDPARLRERVAHSAAELAPDERLELFVIVKNLAHRGSRAWPSEAGYRGAGPTPDALVTIFREALGIEPSR